MTYLVDTHWIVSFLNGRTQAVELFEQLAAEGIIVCGEVYEGFYDQPDAEARLAQFAQFLSTIDLITSTQRSPATMAGSAPSFALGGSSSLTTTSGLLRRLDLRMQSSCRAIRTW